jgi:predicted nucleic acid-binding protein
MNGVKVFIDTNIAIYWLKGDPVITEFLEGKDIYLSFITEMELLSYQGLDKGEEKVITQLLDELFIIELNNNIKKKAIKLRKESAIKLPDAIVVASASFNGLPLMTSDKKLFKIKEVDVIEYYP